MRKKRLRPFAMQAMRPDQIFSSCIGASIWSQSRHGKRPLFSPRVFSSMYYDLFWFRVQQVGSSKNENMTKSDCRAHIGAWLILKTPTLGRPYFALLLLVAFGLGFIGVTRVRRQLDLSNVRYSDSCSRSCSGHSSPTRARPSKWYGFNAYPVIEKRDQPWNWVRSFIRSVKTPDGDQFSDPPSKVEAASIILQSVFKDHVPKVVSVR